MTCFDEEPDHQPTKEEWDSYEAQRGSMRYEVQTLMLHGWENCWTDAEDDSLLTFATLEEAEQEIADHIRDCEESVADGYMHESPDRGEFRVVGVL